MKTSESIERGASTLSRRRFLKIAGTGITFGVVLGGAGVQVFSANESSPVLEKAIGAWVRIDTDGGILIYNPAAEMGQGSMTALPVILAEEMDADWSKVRIEHSPIEPDIYGRSWRRGGRGSMTTVGSRAVSGYFSKLRMAGAQIRRVLLDNVAHEWQVPVAELTTEPSTVIHAASGRRISYGEIAVFAEVPSELPKVDESQLKSPRDFRLIGHSVPRHDIPAKTDGSAQFAMDVHLPGMLHGMISRSPVHGGRPASYNEAEVRAMPGITTTVELEHGIGLIGESIEAVIKAREALDIEWAKGAPAETFDSEASLTGYAEIPGGGRVQARPISGQGDAPAALRQAAKRYEADFLADHVYHAQMEPLNAVVSVNEAGDGAEVWVGTQSTSGARSAAAEALGVDFERITLHPCYLGGGLGRRSNSDYVIEAVHLSNAVKRPVKLMWMREDDLQYGQFRPMCLQRLAAGVDEQGNITAWTHCVVGDGGGLLASGIEIPFYDIPHQHIEMCSVSHGVRLKHWRAVGHGFNKFAIEAFIDEIAVDQAIDPYQFRRTLMRNAPRALKVLDTVAEMADWGGAVPMGRARGIAFGERSGSLAAGVAEVSVDVASGKIRVHRFWCAIDGGIIVQPQNAQAQSEGGIINGLSSVLFERITVKGGKVQQSNYHDYPLLRMSDIPEVEVQFVASYEPPSGLGEASLPVTGGAVANAFAALTGKRLRHLPFSPDRVLEIMG
ncbi:MAG: molybdopterin cofactor-binding domain-containing protein [Rhodothermales bacterium]